MGVLSMSRAIGDAYLQKFGVISDPDVSSVRRTSDDQFLIIASDGLWNNISSQVCAAYVHVPPGRRIIINQSASM